MWCGTVPVRQVSITYGPAHDDSELEALVRSHAITYLFTREKTREWLNSHVRVVRLDGEVGGGLRLLPYRQWFGGRSQPMGAVSAVGIRPDMRSKGLATAMMRSCLEEMNESGIHVSALFPATVRLYRWAGYEISMAFQEWKLDSKKLPVSGRSMPVNETHDRTLVADSYSRWASTHNGVLDRTESAWERIWRPGDSETDNPLAYLIGDGDGHIVLRQTKAAEGWGYHLDLADLVAHNREALERAFTFLADHRSFAREVRWAGPLNDARILGFDEQIAQPNRYFGVMLRIVNVVGALEARGWDDQLNTEFEFEVTDDVCSWNNGAYRVVINEGQAHVERIARAAYRLDIRGLAPLYSGWLSPAQLKAAGMSEGEPGSGLALAFQGPTPWMNDWF